MFTTYWEQKTAADFVDGVTVYDADDIGRENQTAETQTVGALDTLGALFGIGIVSGGAVTVGTGLSVNIAALLGVARHSVNGPCVLRTLSSVARTIPASSTSYLFASMNLSGLVLDDSRITGLPSFAISGSPTLDGGVLLATIVSGVSSITSVTDSRAFINPISGYTNANGQDFRTYQLTELTTIAASATTSTAIQIPAGAVVRSVSLFVSVAIPTATTFSIGVTGAATRYGTALAVAAGTATQSGGTTSPSCYAAATSLLITPNVTPATNAGRVRVCVYYDLATPPTS